MGDVVLGLAALILVVTLNWARMLAMGQVPPGTPPAMVVAIGVPLFLLGLALGWFGLRLRKIAKAPEDELLAKYASGHQPTGFFERKELAQAQQIRARRDAQSARQAILDQAQHGELTAISPSRAILRSGETAYASIQAELCDLRTVSYRGRSSGVSVRVAKGVTVRSGGYRGAPVKQFVTLARGELVVTDKRIIFAGDNKSAEFKLTNLVTIDRHSDGLTFGSGSKTNHFRIQPGMPFQVFVTILNRVLAGN